MKVEEIRIGNYVMKQYYDHKDIVSISGYDFFHYEKREEIDHLVEWNSLSPILLTEDWLIKLGFNKLRDIDFNEYRVKVYGKSIIRGNELHEEKIVISLPFNNCEIGVYNSSEDESSYILDRNIEYVHELQNLYFVLSGEELIIK